MVVPLYPHYIPRTRGKGINNNLKLQALFDTENMISPPINWVKPHAIPLRNFLAQLYSNVWRLSILAMNRPFHLPHGTVSTPSWSVHRWFGFHQFGCFSLPARAQRPGSGVFLAVISSHREWFQRMEKMNFSMVQRLGKTWWNVVETSWTETWWECGEYKQKHAWIAWKDVHASNLFVKDLRVPCIMILKHLPVKQVKELQLWNGNVVETLQMRS